MPENNWVRKIAGTKKGDRRTEEFSVGQRSITGKLLRIELNKVGGTCGMEEGEPLKTKD